MSKRHFYPTVKCETVGSGTDGRRNVDTRRLLLKLFLTVLYHLLSVTNLCYILCYIVSDPDHGI